MKGFDELLVVTDSDGS